MTKHLQLLALTKKHFDFLETTGFKITTEEEGDYSSFLETFFSITYQSPKTIIAIDFYDLQLGIHFKANNITSNYLFIDKNLFNNKSGIASMMFSNIPAAIEKIALDIEHNYTAILNGDDVIWTKIKKLMSTPPVKKSRLP